MKVVVVLSGGMDSATALGRAVSLHGKENVKAITFNYGSKHNAKENAAAQYLAKHYDVTHELIYLDFVNRLFKSDLLSSGGEIPEGHYAEENMKRTVVPYRNAIMLSIAAGYAASHDAEQLVIGNHAGDHAVYPDCRQQFMTPFSEALMEGDWHPVKIDRPFERLTKGQIVAQGMRIGVPYQLTWSCYKGESIACGRCGTCVERLEAFAEAGFEDPIPYVTRTYWKQVLTVSAP